MPKSKLAPILFIVVVAIILFLAHQPVKKESKSIFTNTLEGQVIVNKNYPYPFLIPISTYVDRTFDFSKISVNKDQLYYLYFTQDIFSYSALESTTLTCQLAFRYTINDVEYNECYQLGSSGVVLGGTGAGKYVRSNFMPKSSGNLTEFTLNILKWNENTGNLNLVLTKPSTCTDICSNGQVRCSLDGYQNCADYNNDGCYEWGNVVSCVGGAFSCDLSLLPQTPCKSCNFVADTNCDQCVAYSELISLADKWIQKTASYTDLVNSATQWIARDKTKC